jgi:hypothetical protein
MTVDATMYLSSEDAHHEEDEELQVEELCVQRRKSVG